MTEVRPNCSAARGGAQIRWWGPLVDASGYASEGRLALRTLDSLGVSVRAEPLSHRGRPDDIPAKYRREISKHMEVEPASDYVNIMHLPWTSPWPDENGNKKAWRTMFETDSLPESWVHKSRQVDEIWVPTPFNARSFTSAGVNPHKIRVIPEPVETQEFHPGISAPKPSEGETFVFLSVFKWQLRKGWDLLLKAYIQEFSEHEDVLLLLRADAFNSKVSFDPQRSIQEISRSVGHEAPPVTILSTEIEDQEMPALYAAADAFVLPSRGEGWGRPLAEAMATGKPVIATGWSGNTDFMNDTNSYLIDHSVCDVPDKAAAEWDLYRGHRWAEPSIKHLRQLMRRVLENPQEAKRKGRAARRTIESRFAAPKVCELINRASMDLLRG